MVEEAASKTVIGKRKVIDRGKRSKALTEVKPVGNIYTPEI